MIVIYATPARADIARIYAKTAQRNPAAAQKLEAYIQLCCERLADFPFAAAATDVANVRRLPLVRYPYTVFYRVNSARERVEIVRVVHGARVKKLRRLPKTD